jgi:guanylate kinase
MLYSKHMELDEKLISKVSQYRPSSAALAPIKNTPLLFTVGITAAGKNVVLEQLMELYPNEYYFIVSHTTRAPRENHGIMETDGVEYHFVDFATVDTMLSDEAYFEANVIHFRDVYGTSIAEIEKAQSEGKIAVSDVDIKGVAQYVEYGLNVKPVFLLPPSYEAWMQRLLKRYNGEKPNKHDLHMRMTTALHELEHALTVDYYYIVVNEDLDKTVRLVNDIAHGEPVEPHFQKAMDIAEKLAARIREELDRE